MYGYYRRLLPLHGHHRVYISFFKTMLVFLLKVSTVITVCQFTTVITVIYLDVSGFKMYIKESILLSKGASNFILSF